MNNLPSNIRVTKLNKSFVGVRVPNQKRGDEGNTGRYYHDMLKVSKDKGANIKILDLEVTTRKQGSKAPYTTGTMTYNDIISSDWEHTTFSEKRQRVHEATHDDTFTVHNEIVDETIIDMTKKEIQELLKRDYEVAKAKLIKLGPVATGTIMGGKFGFLEHRGGNTWAHRIPHSGFKKIKAMATSNFNDLFGFE